MEYAFYIIFLFYFIRVLIKRSEFVFAIPVFNVIVDMSFFYFGGVSISTFYRATILIIFIFMVLRNRKLLNPVKGTLNLFLIYTLFLVLQSSELFYSFKGYAQVFFSMFMLPVGYTMINSTERFHKINKEYGFIIIISILVTAYGYIFNVGKTLEYAGEDSEKIGLLGSAGLYTGALCIALLPVIINSFKSKTNKFFMLISSIILYIFILLNVRRTAILIPLIGLVSYIVFSKNRIRNLRYLVLGIGILVGAGSYYSDTLSKHIQLREDRLEPDFYKSEKRYQEIFFDSRDLLLNDKPIESLFGINRKIYAEHVVNNEIPYGARMYHTDIAKLLYGAGLFGLIVYFLIHFQIISIIYHRDRKSVPQIRQMQAMILTLVIVNLAVMFNGSVNLITFKSALFLYLGVLLRQYQNYRYRVSGY